MPAFARLPDEALEELAGLLREERFPAGATVVAEGEAGDRLYLISQGRAEVSAAGPQGAPISDPEFREQMRQNPEGTAEVFAQMSGVKLAEEHRQGLRVINWDLPDEQLAERASKAAMCAWSQYR